MGQWDLLLGSFVSQSLLSSLSPAKQKPSLMYVGGSVPAGYTGGAMRRASQPGSQPPPALELWTPGPTALQVGCAPACGSRAVSRNCFPREYKCVSSSVHAGGPQEGGAVPRSVLEDPGTLASPLALPPQHDGPLTWPEEMVWPRNPARALVSTPGQSFLHAQRGSATPPPQASLIHPRVRPLGDHRIPHSPSCCSNPRTGTRRCSSNQKARGPHARSPTGAEDSPGWRLCLILPGGEVEW